MCVIIVVPWGWGVLRRGIVFSIVGLCLVFAIYMVNFIIHVMFIMCSFQRIA